VCFLLLIKQAKKPKWNLLAVTYRFGSLKASVKKTEHSIDNDDVVGGINKGASYRLCRVKLGADKIRNRFLKNLFSPSLRTASPLASDCQSEAFGLIVSINRTGREYSIRQRRDLDEAKILVNSKKSLPSSLDASQMPMYKGLRAGREFFDPSRHPPFLGASPSPYLYDAEFVQNKMSVSNSNTKSTIK